MPPPPARDEWARLEGRPEPATPEWWEVGARNPDPDGLDWWDIPPPPLPTGLRPGSPAGDRLTAVLRSTPFAIIAAVLFAVLLRSHVTGVYYIPSESMEQTLHGCAGCTGDRVLVDRTAYLRHGPHRGDIVVFDGTGNFDYPDAPTVPAGIPGFLARVGHLAGGPAPGETDYVKRVVGLPGDRIACCGPGGAVTVQRPGGPPEPLAEPYLYQDDHLVFCAAGTGPQTCPPGAPGVLVPPGRLWLMGDHRSRSADSRYHLDAPGNGTVPLASVIGRAAVRLWPPGRFRLLAGP